MIHLNKLSFRKLCAACCFSLYATFLMAQLPQGTSFLNQDVLLTGRSDKQWFKENIPFLEVPDKEIQEVYYYRWFSYYTNLRYTRPGIGYVVTEFSMDVSWQSAFGAIPCSGPLHFYEGRWLKNQNFLNDLSRFWAIGEGAASSHNYSFWMAKANYERYLVNGDADFIKNLYTPLKDHYYGWGNKYNSALGLYWQEGVWDGMENSATSLQADGEAPGYRPSINAYLFAEAQTLSKIAKMVGDEKGEKKFQEDAEMLQKKSHEWLWDNTANFFKHRFRDEIPGTGSYPRNKHYDKESFVDAREVYGYMPWYTEMAEDDPKYIKAWEYLFDGKDGFYAPYGPTTLERSHRLFRYADGGCCFWNGMSWPFSTAQTLFGMANILNDYSNKGIITKEKYVDLLKIFTKTQYKNGSPYVAEAHDPDKAVWTYDLPRSSHYNHSTYNDLIITGLIGLRPSPDDVLTVNPQIPDEWDYFALENVPYHGHLITILYDKTGERYHSGKGLMIYEDGRQIYTQESIRKVSVKIGKPDLSHNYGLAYAENYATNTTKTGYPRPTASYTSIYDDVWEAIDGRIRFDTNPRSRWTNWSVTGQSNTAWFALDYGMSKTINRVDILFFHDNAGTRIPASYTLEYWDGQNWIMIPNQSHSSDAPVAGERNTVRFPSLATRKIRVNMVAAEKHAVGITELETYYEVTDEPIILTATLANAMRNLPYKDSLVVAGGTKPYTFTLEKGTLPVGLSLDDRGCIIGKSTEDGKTEFTLSVKDNAGKECLKVFTIKTSHSEPYTAPIEIPGTVELEYYDKGGEGVAYHDTELSNLGNVFRSLEGVDLFAIGGGGYGVGWTHSGEWMQYTVDVKEAGEYDATIYYATISAVILAELWLDNERLDEEFFLPYTGTWGTTPEGYRTYTIKTTLPAGEHKLRFHLRLCSNGDLDKVIFTKSTSSAVPVSSAQKTVVYPNPSKDKFYLVSSKDIKQALIYDLSGNLVEDIKPSIGSVYFGSSYFKGTYIVKILTDTGVEIRKIVKM